MSAVYTLESNIPLSESQLWDAQRDFFDKQGIHAWKQVPFFITSNTFIAERYARLIVAYLQDIRTLSGFNPNTPVYIVELGAGSGQFSFYCHQALRKMLDQYPDLSDLKVCYVMTDFTESNLSFWDEHPAFQADFRNGKMDYARFDLEEPDTLFLAKSQKKLPQFENPLVLIGNYIFDSVKHDLFRAENGEIKTCQIKTLIAAEDYDKENHTILSLKNISFEHNYAPIQNKSGLCHLRKRKNDSVNRPLTEKRPHSDDDLSALLTFYQHHLDHGDFSLPTTGIHTLSFFLDSAPSGVMLITSDKGYNSLTEIEKSHPKNLVFHGSFSFDVNFHALAQYFQKKGGQTFMQSYREGIKTNVMLSKKDSHYHLERVFQDCIEIMSPADYFRYHTHFKSLEKIDLSLLLSQLELGEFDPYVFSLYVKMLSERIKTAPHLLQSAYIKIIPQIDEHIFALPMGADYYFDLGFFMHSLGEYTAASRYYHKSVAQYGGRFDTLFNLGICAYMLEDYANARLHFEGAKTAAPHLTDVAPWLTKVDELHRNHNKTE